MRGQFSNRKILLIAYIVLILIYWRAQLVAGPYEQSIRSRLTPPSNQLATNP